MKKKGFKKREVEEVDAILPFMSLLIIIIPLLLSNLAFYHFRVVETSRPGASDPNQAQSKTPPDKERKITAKLLIEPKRTKIEFLDESDGNSIKAQSDATSKNGALKLFDLLKTFKKKYPKLNTVMVTTHGDVVYEKMINVLDIFKYVVEGVAAEKKESVDIEVKKEEGFKFNIVIMPAAEELTVKG